MQSSACALTQNYARPDADSLRHVEWLPRNQGPQKSCQHFDSSNLSRWASVSDRARVLGFVKSVDLLLFAGKKEALEKNNGKTISNTPDASQAPLNPADLADHLLKPQLYNPERLGLKGPQGRNHIQENLLGCSGQNQWGEVLDNLEAELRPLAMGCEVIDALYIQQLKPSDSKSRFCSYSSRGLSQYRRSLVAGADPSVASMGKSRSPASWSQEAVSYSSFRNDFSALVGLRGPALKDCGKIMDHYRFVLEANLLKLKAKKGESPCGSAYQSDGPSNMHHQERNTL